jgi:hypothetical protein
LSSGPVDFRCSGYSVSGGDPEAAADLQDLDDEHLADLSRFLPCILSMRNLWVKGGRWGAAWMRPKQSRSPSG